MLSESAILFSSCCIAMFVWGPVQEKKETNGNVARSEFMYLPGTVANGGEERRVVF